MWQDDADADSTLESSERFYVMHDERWRPVATFRDTDSTPKEAFVWHAAGVFSGAGFQPASYIDSLILRDRDNYTSSTPNPMTSASDGTLEERRYYCQNWRADVVAVTKSDGTPIEYVRYSAYGEPTVYPVADLNIDGVVNSTDSALWSDLLYSTSNASVYADTDLDWDGADDWNSGGADGDLFYESYNENLGLSGVGRVSSPSVANRVGYAGYQWDLTLSAYHVRYRVYLPDIGRWTRRDPLGYVDGMGLYEYVRSQATRALDPLGLSGSANPIALPAWLQVLVAQLANQGWTAAQIAAHLAALGVSPWLIAKTLEWTADKAFEVWMQTLVPEIYELLAHIYGDAARVLRNGGCQAADRLFQSYCKSPAQRGNNCDNMKQGVVHCNEYKANGGKHAQCAVARLAIIAGGCPSSHNAIPEAMSKIKAAAKCYLAYNACIQAKSCEGTTGGGLATHSLADNATESTSRPVAAVVRAAQAR